jgi:homoserine dehydrogenase
VADRPGVLAQVAQVFAAHEVSIETVRQRLHRGEGEDGATRAALVVVTHQASDEALSATVDELGRLDVVQAVASVMRVEGE